MNISVLEEISSRFKWKLIKCKKKNIIHTQNKLQFGRENNLDFFFFNCNALFIMTNIYGHYLI